MTRAAPTALSLALLLAACSGRGAVESRTPMPSGRATLQSANVERGRTVFETQCQACHGAEGAGAQIGPSLRNERSRKNLGATIAWIKNPEPPMPKLFPAELSEQNVIDVAAYVQSL